MVCDVGELKALVRSTLVEQETHHLPVLFIKTDGSWRQLSIIHS